MNKIKSEINKQLNVMANYDTMWPIKQEHQIYGEVQMMGRIDGEDYRWFCKDGIVLMIPLSFL